MAEIVPILNKNQMDAFNTIERTHSNILILGQAGTGKSTFVQFLKTASSKRIVCACPTAVSALNIGGQTIHSLFQIQPRDFIMPELLKLKAKPRNILNATDVLVIDEISMVAPDLLDAIDILARQARHNNEPFGGIQIVAIGDMFQLPPVITRDSEQYYETAYEHKNAYFFDANVYKRADFIKYDFDTVYRQNDEELLKNLVSLRSNDDGALAFFNKCCIDDEETRKNAVIITPFRAVAERINSERLNQINAPEIEYTGVLDGAFNANDVPAPMNLKLKQGALVMFVKNGDKWHNGQDDGYLNKLLSGYPNCVCMTGHSHSSLCDERSIWQGRADEHTAVSCGCLVGWAFASPGRENGHDTDKNPAPVREMPMFICRLRSP